MLVALPDGARLAELRELASRRLGHPVERICLGQTDALVVDVADLQDGDTLRVVHPPLERGSSSMPPKADTLDKASSSSRMDEKRVLPVWFDLVRTLLFAAIFIGLERALQTFVFRPYFQPSGERDPALPTDWDLPGGSRST